MPPFNFHHLHYFWAIAHEGNLTRAAARLRVSQSAVSTQLQKLEAQLGHALFTRHGRQLVLTEAGRITLDHADTIFAVGDELVATLGERGRKRHVLRVGSLATLSRNFQLGFLKPLFSRDDVEVVIRSGAYAELLRLLEAHQVDVVLATAAPSRDAGAPWVAHAIGEQPVSLVGAPRRGRRRPRGPRQLAALLATEPLVVPSPDSSVRAGFDALAARLGVRPHFAAEVDDMAMLRLLAREKLGLAVVPSIVVRDELANGTLVELAHLPELEETFYAITLSRRFPNPLLAPLLARSRPRVKHG